MTTQDCPGCPGTAWEWPTARTRLNWHSVEAGGEVILPANTFIATAETVSRIGTVPLLVDVGPEYLLIEPDRAAEAVTSLTQAILPVHLF